MFAAINVRVLANQSTSALLIFFINFYSGIQTVNHFALISESALKGDLSNISPTRKYKLDSPT